MSGRGVNAMPGRPEGEGSARIENEELDEAARHHEIEEEAKAHRHRDPSFFSKLFKRRSSH